MEAISSNTDNQKINFICFDVLLDCNNYKKIGNGNFGFVIQCYTENEINNKYVVKYIDTTQKNINEKKNLETTLTSEMRFLLVLNNDYIVKAYNKLVSFLTTQNILYVVLEYCNGGDLFTYLYGRDTNLPATDVTEDNILNNFTYHIGNALIYIHKQGIIHHDLKLENIFIKGDINGDFTCKLGDFGLAIEPDDKFKLTMRGTIYYLPLYFSNVQSIPDFKCSIEYGNPKLLRNKLENGIATRLTNIPKYFIDWYGYFCIIFLILCRGKNADGNGAAYYNVNVKANFCNKLTMYPICSLNINEFTQNINLYNILFTLMCLELNVFFIEQDTPQNKYYSKLEGYMQQSHTNHIKQSKIYTRDEIVLKDDFKVKSIQIEYTDGAYKLNTVCNLFKPNEYDDPETLITENYLTVPRGMVIGEENES